ncbi:hypothetical protein NBRC111894_4594 [Sporolactobacillus inulinus]|uniref:Uncharacterized protein n=1 Tax=Sporolactobacillus inulinus TaxID=2078 RepID=A0A4Y1ZJ27_9BACL|nr:hypothetical protein NBRC111894_4594 [Sporolactobacillus inulinus]
MCLNGHFGCAFDALFLPDQKSHSFVTWNRIEAKNSVRPSYESLIKSGESK